MTKSFQKAGAILMAVGIFASLLTGCQKNMPDPVLDNPLDSSTSEGQVTSPAVTDVSLSDAEAHEVILPQEFTEGEVVDNLYYKRTTDADGTPVFAVIKAGNGQTAYLPFSETTVYHTENGACYFEKKILTYKLDGEEKTDTHYELWVSDTLPESGQSSASSQGESSLSGNEETAPDPNAGLAGTTSEVES